MLLRLSVWTVTIPKMLNKTILKRLSHLQWLHVGYWVRRSVTSQQFVRDVFGDSSQRNDTVTTSINIDWLSSFLWIIVPQKEITTFLYSQDGLWEIFHGPYLPRLIETTSGDRPDGNGETGRKVQQELFVFMWACLRKLYLNTLCVSLGFVTTNY